MALTTLWRLGMGNLATVCAYRLAIRLRLLEKRLPIGKGYREPLFHPAGMAAADFTIAADSQMAIRQEAEELLQGRLRLFSHRFWPVGSPPAWFTNPLNGQCLTQPDAHWSRLPDFDLELGDLKCLWELSRFDWALLLARAYRLTGAQQDVTFLNAWASDWIEKNPLNCGPNWKCGQETAIRLMQVLLTAFLLGQHRTPTAGLQRFVAEHCRRIAPTIRYAMAQDNNHGTSEAAGLFIGGAWLQACAQPDAARRARQFWRWQQTGRAWLENRVRKLIAPDGSFAQYSLNYHRVLVDTLNIVEFWRRTFALPEFSARFYTRARAAVNWLAQMIDPATGDGPNLGANDGARLFVLSATEYRDYRPTVQLGAVLFAGKRAYPAGIWDEPLQWLGLGLQQFCAKVDTHFARTSGLMRQGGYVVMNCAHADGARSWGLIRYPNFRFRPSHADALHVDLWHQGINILRDSGAYSYNAEPAWQAYFSGTAAHNTVQFDGRDQMPRLGRFLFGSWLRMEQVGDLHAANGQLSWTGAYRDRRQCRHKRTVSGQGQCWQIIDEIEGFTNAAVLRWRLVPGAWRLDGLKCTGAWAELTIRSTRPLARIELVEGCESRYYQEKTPLPVLEIQVPPGKTRLTTEIRLL